MSVEPRPSRARLFCDWGTIGWRSHCNSHLAWEISVQRIVATEVLSIACQISGPERGSPLVLLHGWPDDWQTWNAILPSLHAADYRTIVPSLRGFGETRFKHQHEMRSGQMTAIAEDAIGLADALGLDRFALVGHDWGARAAYIVASRHAERLTHCIALSVAYAASDPDQDIALSQVAAYWYQWYMALPQGERLVRTNGKQLARHAWRTSSPSWKFPESEFEATARSFENSDWAEVTLHSYRQRWGLAKGHPRYAAMEAAMTPAPVISVPTLVLHGAEDRASLPASSEGKEALFSGPYRRRLIDGAGHFPQREAADNVAALIMGFLTDETARKASSVV
jgi:pimeloyl-ACP methyl ester carboxylesterase